MVAMPAVVQQVVGPAGRQLRQDPLAELVAGLCEREGTWAWRHLRLPPGSASRRCRARARCRRPVRSARGQAAPHGALASRLVEALAQRRILRRRLAPALDSRPRAARLRRRGAGRSGSRCVGNGSPARCVRSLLGDRGAGRRAPRQTTRRNARGGRPSVARRARSRSMALDEARGFPPGRDPVDDEEVLPGGEPEPPRSSRTPRCSSRLPSRAPPSGPRGSAPGAAAGRPRAGRDVGAHRPVVEEGDERQRPDGEPAHLDAAPCGSAAPFPLP